PHPSRGRGGVSVGEDRRLSAPKVHDTRVVPGNALLVWIGRVVLLRYLVAEEEIREGLEAVGMPAGDVEGDGIVVADVLGVGLACRAVEDNDARHSQQAGEEIVLAALVVVQASDDALPRERHVRLDGRLRQDRLPAQLHEPAARVLETAQRYAG